MQKERSVIDLEETELGSAEYNATLFAELCDKELYGMPPKEFAGWLFGCYDQEKIVLGDNTLETTDKEKVLDHIALLYYSNHKPS